MGFWSKLFGREAPPVERKSSVPFLVTIAPESDGFIPAITFGGDQLETLLEAAVWSYACITGNAEAIASLEGVAQTEAEGPQDWIRDKEVPLNDFLRNPIGPGVQPEWSWQQVIEVAAQQIYLCGNSYWEIRPIRNGERVVVFPLNPQDVEPKDVNNSGITNRYRVVQRRKRNTGAVRNITPRRIVHIMNASPGSLMEGHAPLSAALRSIEIDQTAHERQKWNLRNKVSPGMVLSVEGLFGLTADQRDEIEEYLRENFQASKDDGRPLVLGEKTKVAAAPETNRQLDYFDTRRFSREEMLAIFKTPPPIVGVYEQATLQNFEQARKIWWSTGLFPMLRTILDAFNRQLVDPYFNNSVNVDIGSQPRQRIWFSLNDSDIGLQLFSEKVGIAQQIVNLGYDANMASARMGLGLPFVEALDITNRDLVRAGRSDALPSDVGSEAEPEPALNLVNDD